MAADRRRGSGKKVCIFDGREPWIVQSDLFECGLPGRSHQASSAVSHPAVIGEVSLLGARPTVLPLQHHLSARAERLQVVGGKKLHVKPLLVKKSSKSKVQENYLLNYTLNFQNESQERTEKSSS